MNRDHKIFVSYRRSDVPEVAGRIFDNLIVDFGPSVFRDVNSMSLGTDFRAELEKVIPRCTVMLVLIGPGWLHRSSDSPPRIFEQDDPVQLEIEVALQAKVPILCALMAGAVKPQRSAVPASLAALSDTAFIAIRPDENFCDDVARLLDLCSETAGRNSALKRIHVPELDADSRAVVRVLAAIGLRLQEVLERVIRNPNELIRELNRDDTDLLAVDGALNAWSRYLGEADEDEMEIDGLPSLIGRLRALLIKLHDEPTWQSIRTELGKKYPDENPGTEDAIARSVGPLILEDFALIHRGVRRVAMPGNPIDFIEATGSDLFLPAVHKVFVTWDKTLRNPAAERAVDHLRASLRSNAVFTQDDCNETDPLPASCNTLILLIGPDFLGEHASDADRRRLEAEVQCALRKRLQIVPTLLPGATIPRASALLEPMRPILTFTIYEIRSDPSYSTDLERLIAFCRGQVTPMFRLGMLALPVRLPLWGELSIHSLLNACLFLRSLLAALASGRASMSQLPAELQATLRASNITLNVWGKYFMLIPTDRWLDEEGLTYRPPTPR